MTTGRSASRCNGCWRGDEELELSKTEFDLLELLAFNAGEVIELATDRRDDEPVTLVKMAPLLGRDPLGVVPGGDQHLRGDAEPDSERAEELRDQ